MRGGCEHCFGACGQSATVESRRLRRDPQLVEMWLGTIGIGIHVSRERNAE
jgi:hypothetical protein